MLRKVAAVWEIWIKGVWSVGLKDGHDRRENTCRTAIGAVGYVPLAVEINVMHMSTFERF
jgi:hypothetical protein